MAYLWESLKDKVYETSPEAEEDPGEIMGHAVLAGSGDVFQEVFQVSSTSESCRSFSTLAVIWGEVMLGESPLAQDIFCFAKL